MTERKLKIIITAELRARLPNFLRYGPGEADLVHVAEVDDESLHEFGEAWTDALIEKAQESRRRKVDRADDGRRGDFR